MIEEAVHAWIFAHPTLATPHRPNAAVAWAPREAKYKEDVKEETSKGEKGRRGRGAVATERWKRHQSAGVLLLAIDACERPSVVAGGRFVE